jgi:hypothetical protein
LFIGEEKEVKLTECQRGAKPPDDIHLRICRIKEKQRLSNSMIGRIEEGRSLS